MKYLLALILLTSCKFAEKKEEPKPCSKIQVKKEISVPVVGDCYVSDRWYNKSGPFYKIKEVGRISTLVEYRKNLSTKKDAVLIYTFEDISNHFTKIDCLGDLKK
jgi:hypothetical protein